MSGCIFKNIKKKVTKEDEKEIFLVSFEFVANDFDEALEIKKEVEEGFKEDKKD